MIYREHVPIPRPRSRNNADLPMPSVPRTVQSNEKLITELVAALDTEQHRVRRLTGDVCTLQHEVYKLRHRMDELEQQHGKNLNGFHHMEDGFLALRVRVTAREQRDAIADNRIAILEAQLVALQIAIDPAPATNPEDEDPEEETNKEEPVEMEDDRDGSDVVD